jgi:hypothetical protein
VKKESNYGHGDAYKSSGYEEVKYQDYKFDSHQQDGKKYVVLYDERKKQYKEETRYGKAHGNYDCSCNQEPWKPMKHGVTPLYARVDYKEGEKGYKKRGLVKTVVVYRKKSKGFSGLVEN